MKVFKKRGICVQDDGRELWLDPGKARSDGIVTHGHSDHLVARAHMTEPTLEVLKIRQGRQSGQVMPLDQTRNIGGFDVTLHDAGHVLGSAMVEVEGLLYTGDFNPYGSVTAGKAEPLECDLLITEATYGKPSMVLPPREEVIQDLWAWFEAVLHQGPAIVGAYSLGKAQEVVAIANSLGVDVVVAEAVAKICDIYVRHGVPLEYQRLGDLSPAELKEPRVMVLPNGQTMGKRVHPMIKELKEAGGQTAFVSGWCSIYSYVKQGVDAQFPLSDHADFAGLMDFAEACSPKRIFTVHGSKKELARELERRLGVPAQPLGSTPQTLLENFTTPLPSS